MAKYLALIVKTEKVRVVVYKILRILVISLYIGDLAIIREGTNEAKLLFNSSV